MNSLNSVLIEGVLTEDPVQTDDDAVFFIRSVRYFKVLDGIHEEVTEIPAEVKHSNTKLWESVLTSGKAGRSVRVVGRLGMMDSVSDSLGIVVEHLEFRPEAKASK